MPASSRKEMLIPGYERVYTNTHWFEYSHKVARFYSSRVD